MWQTKCHDCFFSNNTYFLHGWRTMQNGPTDCLELTTVVAEQRVVVCLQHDKLLLLLLCRHFVVVDCFLSPPWSIVVASF